MPFNWMILLKYGYSSPNILNSGCSDRVWRSWTADLGSGVSRNGATILARLSVVEWLISSGSDVHEGAMHRSCERASMAHERQSWNSSSVAEQM